MTQPACERCSRPVADMAYVCIPCAGRPTAALQRAALVAGEAVVTITKMARVGIGGRRTATEPPLPVNLGAGRDHDAAVNTLTTWARHIHEESGRPLPTVRRDPCGHTTCHDRAFRRAEGPLCGGEAPEHPTAALALWLASPEQMNWLRHRQEGNDALDEIEDACSVLERVVDRPADRVIVGQCGCGAYLYAVQGAKTVKCRDCNTSYDVESSREGLRQNLDERLLTAAEIALMAAYLGLTEQRERTRKLITMWAQRGLIASHAAVGGEPAYLFGEVVTRLAASKRAA